MIKEKFDVRCNKCGWEGYEEDLEMVAEIVSSSSEIKDAKTEWINACPNCKTDNYLMDIE